MKIMKRFCLCLAAVLALSACSPKPETSVTPHQLLTAMLTAADYDEATMSVYNADDMEVFFGVTGENALGFAGRYKGADKLVVVIAANGKSAEVRAALTAALKGITDNALAYPEQQKRADAAVLCEKNGVFALSVLGENNDKPYQAFDDVLSGKTPPPAEPQVDTTSVSVAEESSDVTNASPVVTTTAADTSAFVDTEETNVTTPDDSDGVYLNDTGVLLVREADGNWRGISVFGGGTKQSYIAAMTTLRAALPSDVNLWSMLCPLSGEWFTPPNFTGYGVSQTDKVNAVNAATEEAGVLSVNVPAELANHTGENIYLRTDHHWSALGAYYGAKAFAKAAGLPFADLNDSNFTTVTREGFVGTMWNFTGKDSRIANSAEPFVYYKPIKTKYTTEYFDTSFNFQYETSLFVEGQDLPNSYSIVMGGDNKIVKIKTDVGNGRKLMIFKDSYGNATVPFLLGSFDEIVVCDLRYFDLNALQFINEQGTTDVAIIQNIQMAMNPANARLVERLAE
ncbi:MAG: hypothetical protein LBN40_04150 [Oscillospiraceae bacterium]|jgi:hypothetical protein|nr:hypothetical protein [Oscillospiraceae bacterium]